MTITITLTVSQQEAVINALQMAINPDYPKSDQFNAMYQRIIKKIEREQDK